MISNILFNLLKYINNILCESLFSSDVSLFLYLPLSSYAPFRRILQWLLPSLYLEPCKFFD